MAHRPPEGQAATVGATRDHSSARPVGSVSFLLTIQTRGLLPEESSSKLKGGATIAIAMPVTGGVRDYRRAEIQSVQAE